MCEWVCLLGDALTRHNHTLTKDGYDLWPLLFDIIIALVGGTSSGGGTSSRSAVTTIITGQPQHANFWYEQYKVFKSAVSTVGEGSRVTHWWKACRRWMRQVIGGSKSACLYVW